MVGIERIPPTQAHEDISRGALLVCAYDDPAKFEQYRLAGAISLNEFQNRVAGLARDQEIIFYCA